MNDSVLLHINATCVFKRNKCTANKTNVIASDDIFEKLPVTKRTSRHGVEVKLREVCCCAAEVQQSVITPVGVEEVQSVAALTHSALWSDEALYTWDPHFITRLCCGTFIAAMNCGSAPARFKTCETTRLTNKSVSAFIAVVFSRSSNQRLRWWMGIWWCSFQGVRILIKM